MRAHHRSTLPVRLSSLTLSYMLLISLGLPFTPQPSAAVAVAGSEMRLPATNAPPASQQPARREGELLVRFREGVSEQEKTAVVEAKGARRQRRLRGRSGLEQLAVVAGQSLETVATQLRGNPAVELVEPNFLIALDQIVPNDPRFAEQWALKNTGEAGGQAGADINAAMAWHNTTGSPETIIAVIDSGIDFTHPDLANNQWTNPHERANERDDDRNDLIDDLHGWDWVDDGNNVGVVSQNLC